MFSERREKTINSHPLLRHEKIFHLHAFHSKNSTSTIDESERHLNHHNDA